MTRVFFADRCLAPLLGKARHFQEDTPTQILTVVEFEYLQPFPLDSHRQEWLTIPSQVYEVGFKF